MPNRILKETICTSDNLDHLSPEAESFFYRLLVQCDDYGRMDARPPILLSRCFPLRLDRITTAMISQWLDQLRHAELITIYTVNGKPYIQFNTWDKHQQVRAKRSKFPSPDDGLIADDSNCDQLIANVPVIQSNPIRIQSNASDDAQQPEKQNHRQAAIAHLESSFSQLSGLPLPKRDTDKDKKASAASWWIPLGDIWTLCGKDTDRASLLIEKSYRKLIADSMTVASPKSLVKTATAIYAQNGHIEKEPNWL